MGNNKQILCKRKFSRQFPQDHFQLQDNILRFGYKTPKHIIVSRGGFQNMWLNGDITKFPQWIRPWLNLPKILLPFSSFHFPNKFSARFIFITFSVSFSLYISFIIISQAPQFSCFKFEKLFPVLLSTGDMNRFSATHILHYPCTKKYLQDTSLYKILELRRKKFLLLTLIKNPEMKSNFRNLQKKKNSNCISFIKLFYWAHQNFFTTESRLHFASLENPNQQLYEHT